jgi:hypothetical protein
MTMSEIIQTAAFSSATTKSSPNAILATTAVAILIVPTAAAVSNSISGRTKQGRKGKFMSFSFKAKEESTARQAAPATDNEW